MSGESEARERLLEAWRGEIIAGQVYELIAQRMPEREAAILGRMAEAEGGHRRRLEARMTELGIEIPSRESVRLSPWLRLQARIAPVDRLLAAREAAEDEEVGDLYKRSTGDPTTDELLRSIRKEERAHSHAVNEMRSGIAESDGAEAGGAPAPAHPAQVRLNKIIGREKWHQTGGGWISGAIYGANDGLAAVFGIVAGVSGATGGSTFVLTADSMAAQLATQPDAMLKALSAEEFGVTGEHGNPTQAAVAAGISTGVGAVVPVIPFIFTTGTVAIVAAAIISQERVQVKIDAPRRVISDELACPLDRLMGRAPGSKPEAVGMEMRIEHRREHLRDGLADQPIHRSRHPQLPLTARGLGDHHPPDRLRPVGARLER